MAFKPVYDDEYRSWIRDIRNRYRASQIKTAIAVNRELISFYWLLGKDIVEREAVKNMAVTFIIL